LNGRGWPVVLRRLVGLLALFSGFALLLTIIGHVSLVLALAGTTLVLVGGIGIAVRSQDPETRRWTLRTAAVGAIVGFVGTAAYDVSKAVLSTVDPSPYNPFEVLRIFGQLFLGPAATGPGVVLVGGAFHVLNGTAFAIAYAFLFARDGRSALRWALLTGMGWGVFLELFQLALYPGWLSIGFLAEFATISALSHLVYGATVGLLARAGLRRYVVAA
jgi:hypothetical protein